MTKISDELIDGVIAAHTRHGRPEGCPLITWLRLQRDRPAQAVRAEMVHSPHWKPGHSVEGLAAIVTRIPADPDSVAAQTLYANHITSSADPRDKRYGKMVLRPAVLARMHPPVRGQIEAWLA